MKHWWRWDTSNRDERYKQSYFLIAWLVSLCSDAHLPVWEEISKVRLAKTREFIIFSAVSGSTAACQEHCLCRQYINSLLCMDLRRSYTLILHVSAWFLGD